MPTGTTSPISPWRRSAATHSDALPAWSASQTSVSSAEPVSSHARGGSQRLRHFPVAWSSAGRRVHRCRRVRGRGERRRRTPEHAAGQDAGGGGRPATPVGPRPAGRSASSRLSRTCVRAGSMPQAEKRCRTASHGSGLRRRCQTQVRQDAGAQVVVVAVGDDDEPAAVVAAPSRISRTASADSAGRMLDELAAVCDVGRQRAVGRAADADDARVRSPSAAPRRRWPAPSSWLTGVAVRRHAHSTTRQVTSTWLVRVLVQKRAKLLG